MITKVYKITVAFESDEEGYSQNASYKNVSAISAKEAIAKMKLDENEFVDGVEFLCAIDPE